MNEKTSINQVRQRWCGQTSHSKNHGLILLDIGVFKYSVFLRSNSI
jgi:hypothetical protein